MAGFKHEVLEALTRLHASQDAHDVDAVAAAYATDGFVTRSAARSAFERLIEAHALRDRTVDMSACEVFVFRDRALVKPVVYRTPRATRGQSFHLDRQGDGSWLIVDSRRSRLPGERVYGPEFVANAGQLIGSRGMRWVRTLDAPIEAVWDAVSTKHGLDRWWLTRSVEIDLRPGGTFAHHWTNTVREFKVNEFIEFVGSPAGASRSQDLMRFDLKRDGSGTVFSFFDAFSAHQRPLSLPWTASGWHLTVDALESALTGRVIENDFGFGGDFYWDHLREHHALAERLGTLDACEIGDEDWKTAYLAPAL